MSIEEIRSRISVVNAETARLNTQRNQNIGKKETLQKQLDDAFALYEKNYGVKLTEGNLQSELETVTSEKEAELAKIEQIIGCINSGDIAQANNLAGVVTEEVKVEPKTEEKVQNTPSADNVILAEQIGNVTTPVPETVATPSMPTPVPETVATPPVTPSIPTPTVSAPVTKPIAPPSMMPNVAPPIAPPIVPPVVQPKETVLTGADTLGMPALEGFTKQGLGSLTPPTPQKTDSANSTPVVQDFGAILNGTAFKS